MKPMQLHLLCPEFVVCAPCHACTDESIDVVVNAGAIEAVVPLIAGPSTADEAKSRDASTPRSDTRCYLRSTTHAPAYTSMGVPRAACRHHALDAAVAMNPARCPAHALAVCRQGRS